MKLADENVVAPELELVSSNLEDVSRRPRDEQLVLAARASGLERLAQMRDIALEHVAGRLRWRCAPQLVDHPVRRKDLVRVEQEQRKHGPLLCTAEGQERPVRGDLKRAKDAEVELVRAPTVARERAADKPRGAGLSPGRPRTSRRCCSAGEHERRPAPGRALARSACRVLLSAEPERRDHQCAEIAQEVGVPSGVANDLDADEVALELRAGPGCVDDERAGVPGENTATCHANDLCSTFERPLVRIDAARVTRDEHVGERIGAVAHDSQTGGRAREDLLADRLVARVDCLVRIVPDGEVGSERVDDRLAGPAEVDISVHERAEPEVLDIRIPRAGYGAEDERCCCDCGRDREKRADNVRASPTHGTPPEKSRWWPGSEDSLAGTPPLIPDGPGRALELTGNAL